MSCKCDCGSDAVAVQSNNLPQPKRYYVSGSKNSYVSESYDTLEEALAKIEELVADGYPGVTFRDNEDQDGDGVW